MRTKKISFHGHGDPEPIGLEYISSLLEINGFPNEILGNNQLKVFPQKSNKALRLFSAITCEYPKILNDCIKAKNNGEITVLGGYHSSSGVIDFKKSPFDYFVIGEGEEVALGIAQKELFNDGSILKNFKMKTIGRKNIIWSNRIEDLDKIPFPKRSIERINRYQYHLHDLMWPPTSKQKNAALVLGSRGCKFNCSFCASSTIWGNRIRFRSPQNILNEIKEIVQKFETNTLVFIDQSFGINQEWSYKLLNSIKRAGIKLNWYHQSNLNISKKIIEEMAISGCRKIGFGVEGVSEKAISQIKPINPKNIDEINSLFELCNNHGIFVKAYLMIGYPWEDEKCINEYFKNIKKIRANQIKISFFTPFPGTKDWFKYEKGLINKDFENFDTVKMPVVYNPNISTEKYFKIREELFWEFYGSKNYLDTTQNILKKYPEYLESFIEFCGFLKKFKMVNEKSEFIQWIKKKARGFF